MKSSEGTVHVSPLSDLMPRQTFCYNLSLSLFNHCKDACGVHKKNPRRRILGGFWGNWTETPVSVKFSKSTDLSKGTIKENDILLNARLGNILTKAFLARFCVFFFILGGMSFVVSAQEEAGGGLWYQDKPIRRIQFEGLRHVKAGELDGIIEQYIGQKLTDAVFLELQGSLYALEYFDVISPRAVPFDSEGSAVILRFAVTERPVISKISFEGWKGLRISELRDLITIKVNDVYNENKVRVDETVIVAKYIEKGFPDIKLRYETTRKANDTIEVTFKITEGERLTIDQINFEGNTKFKTRTLRGQLSLKVKGIFEAGPFQEAKLVQDRYAIAQYYHARGYIDAEVIDITRPISKDSKGNQVVSITFKIFEGRLYNFEGVSFKGNVIFSDEQLQALIRSKQGRIVNAQLLEADLQRVTDIYHENGYIYSTIRREERRNMEAGAISYVIHIEERDRGFIENIIVRGNKKTKDHVIFRELTLEAGDIFSKAKVYDSQRNLYNLRYFSSIAIETPPGSADGLLDLIFTVEEQPMTDIQAGLTFSGSSDPNAFPMSGLIKWTDRNFLGYGNTFGVETNISPDVQDVSLQYTQKWLFGLPLSGGLDLTVQHADRLGAMDNQFPRFDGNEDYAFPDGFISYDEYNGANKTPPDEYLFKYSQWNVSLGFSTGYRWGTPLGIFGVGGGTRVGFKLNDYDRDKYRAFDSTIRERDFWTPATSVSFSVSLDGRDIYYDPSKGYYLVQRLGIYGLLPQEIEEEYFMRTDSKAEMFFTLWNWQLAENWAFKGILGFHSGLSFLFAEPGRPDPIVEQANMLALDGMFIARGWTGERYRRGLSLWENWAELRLPIVPGILAIDGFFDAAEIATRPGDIFTLDSNGTFTDRMRFSFGGGLRFAIPQFPFRFLFARRFRIVSGNIWWEDGMLGGNGRKDGNGAGVDFVLSFALSTY
jgi:outer membrane protein insertion porin family